MPREPREIDTVIALHPPRDGRHWDNQCARCGSSMHLVYCDNCGGEGVSGHDCGEDCCCCAEPEENEECDWCNGRGGHWACLSSDDWCQQHPRDGREQQEPMPEWFTFDAPRKPASPEQAKEP